MNPDTIIFAIQAGVRVGRYFNKVLIDKKPSGGNKVLKGAVGLLIDLGKENA